jgi:hypothetical protein
MAPNDGREKWCQQFVEHMCRRAPFPDFDDGTSVREYAEQAAPTYWEDPDQREDGPEECADADISYWGDE